MTRKPRNKTNLLSDYPLLLNDIKRRIQTAQAWASFSANREMLALYWDIGRILDTKKKIEGWGSKVLKRLADDLKNELPGIRGFSERNLKRMIQFFQEYPHLFEKGPPPVAQLRTEIGAGKGPPVVAQLEISKDSVQLPVLNLPWSHNTLLIQMVKDMNIRRWYMEQALAEGWSRNVLQAMIKGRTHERQGQAVSNFDLLLPPPQSDMAKQALKDPYVFDFLTLEAPFRERELELGLIRHLEKFLLELGAGFAFVGRQVHLDVAEEDFYIDLLFYHLQLRSFVVVDLKIGPFKPEYAGKINFYCNVVDDQMRHETDHPTIGLILCQDKKKILAEYALRGMNKPIGVSEYELTRTLPDELKSSLPSIEELEKELTEQAEAEGN